MPNPVILSYIRIIRRNFYCHNVSHAVEDTDSANSEVTIPNNLRYRSQWPRGLRRGSAAACLLGIWVRFPPVAWMSVVSVVCCRVEVSASGWSLVLIVDPLWSETCWGKAWRKNTNKMQQYRCLLSIQMFNIDNKHLYCCILLVFFLHAFLTMHLHRDIKCWGTFKYFIILIVSTYYILCISWILKCLKHYRVKTFP